MSNKVSPLVNKCPDMQTDDFIELEPNSVVLTNPEHQRAFNAFRLTHASVLFHIAVLVLIIPLNFLWRTPLLAAAQVLPGR